MARRFTHGKRGVTRRDLSTSAGRLSRLHTGGAAACAPSPHVGRPTTVAVGRRPRPGPTGRFGANAAESGPFRLHVRPKGSRTVEPDRRDAKLPTGPSCRRSTDGG